MDKGNVTQFDFVQEVLALREDALRWGGWDVPCEKWMPQWIGRGTHCQGLLVPNGYARKCVRYLFDLEEPLEKFADLPRGPAQALLNRLYPIVWVDEYNSEYGIPPAELGKFLMEGAYERLAGLVPIEPEAAQDPTTD